MRLQRVRAGVNTAATGLGLLALFAVVSLHKPELLLMGSAWWFFIGLGIMLNGLLFTVRKLSAFARRRSERGCEFSRRIIGVSV